LGLVIGLDLVIGPSHWAPFTFIVFHVLTYFIEPKVAKNGGKLFYACMVCGNNRRSDRFPKGDDKTICSSCLNRKLGSKSVMNVS